MKKYFGSVMFLLIIGFVFCCPIGHAEEKYKNYGENYEWIGYINNSGEFVVCGYNGIHDYVGGTLEIPSQIEGYTVTEIEPMGNKFSIFSPELVNKLIIPKTIEYIDRSAFRDLFKNLNSIELYSDLDDEAEWFLESGLFSEISPKIQEITLGFCLDEFYFSDLEKYKNVTLTIANGEEYISLDLSDWNVNNINFPSQMQVLSLTGYQGSVLNLPAAKFSAKKILIYWQQEGVPNWLWILQFLSVAEAAIVTHIVG